LTSLEVGTAVNGRVFGGDFPIDSEKHARNIIQFEVSALYIPFGSCIRIQEA